MCVLIFQFSDKKIYAIKPLTFMNESGKFLKTLLSKNNCEISQTILIHDEINLPVGQMKVTLGRGDGGHNGVKSVFASSFPSHPQPIILIVIT